MKWLPEWTGDVLASVVVGACGYLFRLIQRISTIETLNISRDDRLDKVELKLDKHDELVIHMNTLVTEFKEAMPGLREVGQVASKLEGIIEMQNRRLELVENTLLGAVTRHTL